jgi:hypothetical protein
LSPPVGDFRDADSLAEISSAPDRNRCDPRGGISDSNTVSREEHRHPRPYCLRLFAIYARLHREARLSAG